MGPNTVFRRSPYLSDGHFFVVGELNGKDCCLLIGQQKTSGVRVICILEMKSMRWWAHYSWWFWSNFRRTCFITVLTDINASLSDFWVNSALRLFGSLLSWNESPMPTDLSSIFKYVGFVHNDGHLCILSRFTWAKPAPYDSLVYTDSRIRSVRNGLHGQI